MGSSKFKLIAGVLTFGNQTLRKYFQAVIAWEDGFFFFLKYSQASQRRVKVVEKKVNEFSFWLSTRFGVFSHTHSCIVKLRKCIIRVFIVKGIFIHGKWKLDCVH